MKISSSSTNENGGNMPQEWKIVSRYWPSSILVIAMTWGDHNKDGKVKSIIRFQRNRP
jgi:aryl-phospho-beta-D-glucosidase BglC (GH1 family)